MTDQFDVKGAAKNVEQLANRAGLDWDGRPAAYTADAAKLSQEVSMLARSGHLEDVLAQIKKDSSIWDKKGGAPDITHVDRNGDGRISGIGFNCLDDHWIYPAYATVTTDMDKDK